MHITTKNGDKELYIQTITLQPQETPKLYGFHCVACGNVNSKIGGKVSKIYPVYEPSEQVPVVTKCGYCRSEYTFQTYDGYSKDEVKVILHPLEQKEMNYFYCWRGKDVILEFTSSSIYSWVERKNKTTPFVSTCTNPKCDITYFFSDIL